MVVRLLTLFVSEQIWGLLALGPNGSLGDGVSECGLFLTLSPEWVNLVISFYLVDIRIG